MIDTGISEAAIVNVTIRGLGGNDELTAAATLGTRKVTLQGFGGDDTLVANNSGVNQIRGGEGADVMIGGVGRDQFIIDQFDPPVFDQGGLADTANAIDATAGLSIVSATTGIDVFLGSAFDDLIDLSGSAQKIQLSGGAGNDTLSGGNNADTIRGDDGDDVIHGWGGKDILLGGQGGDALHGDADRDVVDYTLDPSGVLVDLSTGQATDGWLTDDTISGVEDIRGSSFSDSLIGDAGNNDIRGNNGNDTIEGKGGGDTLFGNAGNDAASYESSPVGVTVNLGVVLQSSAGDAGGDRLNSFEYLIGSAFADTLTGTSGANFIFGGGSSDIIFGLGGNDFLYGEGGDDQIFGGDGVDNLFGGAGFDQMDGGLQNDLLHADSDDDDSGLFTGGDGTDRLMAEDDLVGVNWVLNNASLENIQGSSVDDIISLGTTTDGVQLSGRGGNDNLTGGQGADAINAGDGNDTVSGGLGADVLRGGNGDDTLYGNLLGIDDGVQDRLFGDADNDTAQLFPFDTSSSIETLI